MSPSIEGEEPEHCDVARTVTGRAGNSPGQGPFLFVTLDVFGERIRKAAYETYQCPGCVACGQAIVAMVAGITVAEARALRHADVVNKVGPMPRHRQICYGLAILALDDALNQLEKA